MRLNPEGGWLSALSFGLRAKFPRKGAAEKWRGAGGHPLSWTPFLRGPTWGIRAHWVWRRCFLTLRAGGLDVEEVHPGVAACLLQNLVQWLVH